MIALLLSVFAQAESPLADGSPSSASPAQHQVCHRTPGSEMVVCGPRIQQRPYRLMNVAPRAYGPPQPYAQSDPGQGVKLRGQATNSGKRTRSGATLSVPF